jgi:hypothetical protein
VLVPIDTSMTSCLCVDDSPPDFLIEVLQGTREVIEGLDFLGAYECRLIEPVGLQKRPNLEADECHRDWLLRAPVPLSPARPS